MATTRSRILLLTQSPSLEQEFKTALMAETAHNAGMQHHGVRLQVVAAPDGRTLGPLLRRGVDLVAFDLALSAEALAESVAALDEFRDVPVLGLGEADERWHQLLRGSPIEDLVEIPFEAEALRQQLDQLLERGRFLRGSDLVGQSPAMRQLRERILLVAPTPVSSILLTGESGAGKDRVAEALHRYSTRRDAPFRPLNCGAIPENLLENELFGHEKGAFTDARAQHRGIFEQANGGTVFLDEIGEMSLAAQVRLLRVFEQREITRIGGDAVIPVDIRIIAATNRDLQEAVSNREFRLDLYHRLKVVELNIPPLRRRTEDIPLLIERFIGELARGNKSRLEGFSPAAMDLLQSYAWPGNVRELRNLVEHLVFLAPRSLVEPEDLLSLLESPPAPERHLPVPTNKTPDQSERELIYFALLDLKREVSELKNAVERMSETPHHTIEDRASRRDAAAPMQHHAVPPIAPPTAPPVVQSIAPEVPHQAIYSVEDGRYESEDRVVETAAIEPLRTLKDMEKEAIEQALDRVGGNRRKAADILGISARTLYRKLKEYGLE